jgi:anti-sigma factor RsiW
MQCPRQSAELIVGYGARTLDAVTEAAFEQHLASCTECRKAVAAQGTVWSALDEYAWRISVPLDFDRRLFQRIAEEERRRWTWRLSAAAACAILAALMLLRQPWSEAPTHSPAQPALQIEQVEHALDDMDMLDQVVLEQI